MPSDHMMRTTVVNLALATNCSSRPSTSLSTLGFDGICPPSHQPDEYGKRLFLGWGQAQGRSPHAPGISKNASDPVGIPLKKGASGAG